MLLEQLEGPDIDRTLLEDPLLLLRPWQKVMNDPRFYCSAPLAKGDE